VSRKGLEERSGDIFQITRKPGIKTREPMFWDYLKGRKRKVCKYLLERTGYCRPSPKSRRQGMKRGKVQYTKLPAKPALVHNDDQRL